MRPDGKIQQIKEGTKDGLILFPDWKSRGRRGVIDDHWSLCDQFVVKFTAKTFYEPVLALNCCDREHFVLNYESSFHIRPISPVLDEWWDCGPYSTWIPNSKFGGIANGADFVSFLQHCMLLSQEAVMDLPMDE